MKFDEKLEALAAHHENVAKAIRLTASVLNGNETAKAQSAINGKLKNAIKHRRKTTTNGHTSLQLIQQVLAEAGRKLTRDELRSGLAALGAPRAMIGIGNGILHGYIKQTGKPKTKSARYELGAKRMEGAPS